MTRTATRSLLAMEHDRLGMEGHHRQHFVCRTRRLLHVLCQGVDCTFLGVDGGLRVLGFILVFFNLLLFLLCLLNDLLGFLLLLLGFLQALFSLIHCLDFVLNLWGWRRTWSWCLCLELLLKLFCLFLGLLHDSGIGNILSLLR